MLVSTSLKAGSESLEALGALLTIISVFTAATVWLLSLRQLLKSAWTPASWRTGRPAPGPRV